MVAPRASRRRLVGGPRAGSAARRALEQLAVGGAGRLAVAGAGLLARSVLLTRARPARAAFQRADAERHPLRRVLEPVRLHVAAGVGLLEVAWLDPHPLALEQAEDAGLAGLGPLVLAVAAPDLVVRGIRLGLLVGRDVALVVPQDHLVVRIADEVVRHDRDLAAATGRIDDEGRDRVARGMAAEALHDLEALADRRSEVARSLDEVALVQVVRPDPVLDESMHERALDVDAVVDPGEQDALVPDGDPGPGELVDRSADLGGDLVRVVEVEVHPERVVLREHRAE